MEYLKDYNYDNAIRVWSGLSWAVIDRRTGAIVQENDPIFCAPGLTDAEKQEAREAVSRMVDAPFGGDVYIRFNDLPKRGKSQNFATGKLERGVSCYAAVWDYISGCYKRTGSGLDGAMIAYVLSGAPIYLISGNEVAKGSDGEPIVHDAKILASLVFCADKDGYIVEA